MKGLRIAGAALMVASAFGPLAVGPTPAAEAKSREWGDVRPPLTDDNDSTDTDGFTALPTYGPVFHATAIAPNGDIYTAGQPTAGAWNIFRSTNGGKNWRSAATPNVPTTSIIRQIAISPDYPSDGWIGFVYSDDTAADGAPSATDNGFCWATTFPQGTGASFGTTNCIDFSDNIGATTVVSVSAANPAVVTTNVPHQLVTGNTVTITGLNGTGTAACVIAPASAITVVTTTTFSVNGCDNTAQTVLPTTGTVTPVVAAGGVFQNINMRTIAISPDFNWNDGNGSVAIGGNQEAGTSSVAIGQVSALKTVPAAVDFVLTTDPDGDATDVTGHLAYTHDEEPIQLARFWVNLATAGDGAGGAGSYGQLLTGGAWPTATTATQLSTSAADFGQVAFDDEFTAGGSYFAALSIPGAPVGGVYRNDGSAWSNKTSVDDVCNADISSFTVSGNGSSTKIVASINASNIVCRTTNEGSSWSDNDTDGGDDVCNSCSVTATGAFTYVASNRANPSVVYYTSSAALGGIFRSESTGSSWADTGLTNLAYTVSSVREIDASKAFANVSAPGGEDAIFYTEDYGTGAGWMRVLRTSRTDLSFGPGLGDLATSGKTFARFTNTGAVTDKILVTTNGGKTWDDLNNPDPFENGPDSNENVVAESIRSSSLVYYGGDKGHVAVSSDGGQTWTILAKDFGDDIDEFDMTSDATTFFVTAEDSDNTNKVWMTKDTGATFTQVGATPWGTGDGTINLDIAGFKVADGTGWLLVMTAGLSSTDEVYRLKMPDGQWEDLDLDTEWTDSTTFTLKASADGVGLILWRASGLCGGGEGQLVYISRPFTGLKEDMTAPGCSTGATVDPVLNDAAKNTIFQLPNPPLVAGTAMSTARTLPGYNLQFVNGNRIMELTLPADFTDGLVANSPINGLSVPTNIGDEGVPAILRWNSVSTTDRYLVRIGLQPDLIDATVLGCPATVPDATPGGGGVCTTGDSAITSAQAVVDRSRYALIAGQTYYWDVQEIVAENRPLQGPRSATASFTVSTTSTQVISPVPSLPSNGANLPGVATQLSWNNPAGVTQVHLQVTPLNGDGPAINLIMNSTNFYNVPAPVFGTGPYVMLPGATYTWRVRVSGSTTAIGETDNSWGPWSQVQTFTTAKPNAGSIQLVAPINGAAITDTTPALEWKSSNPSDFYYEVQLSSDPNFGEQGIKAAVFHNLIHGGVSTPPNTWVVPDANALPKGQYYWRVRQRVQATPAGAAETGIAWSPAQGFVVN